MMEFDTVGACVIDGVFSPDEMRPVIEAIEALDDSDAVRRRRARTFAVRNALVEVPAARRLAESKSVQSLARLIAGEHVSIARAIIFDKNPDANWAVPWHQDTTIAVRNRVEVTGFGPWSVKAGVIHVQPPAAVLERMATIRIHLDNCDSENGALQVLPGSHQHGILSTDQIDGIRRVTSPLTCDVSSGGVMCMRPLVLHASSPASVPRHRRVLHLEFAGDPLPGGLQWTVEGQLNRASSTSD